VLLAVCLSWMCAFMDDWTLLFTCIAIVRLVPAVIARGLTQPQTAASQPVPTDAVGYHSCIDAVWTTSLCDGRDEGTHRSCCWEGCIFTLSCFPRQHRKLIGEALALPRGLEIEGPSYYLGSGDLVFYSGEGTGTRGTLKRCSSWCAGCRSHRCPCSQPRHSIVRGGVHLCHHGVRVDGWRNGGRSRRSGASPPLLCVWWRGGHAVHVVAHPAVHRPLGPVPAEHIWRVHSIVVVAWRAS